MVYVWDGVQATAGVPYVWDGSQAHDATMRAIPVGYRSVGHMLAQDTFYWAHRGGSAVVPEMSLYAYTRAADQGFGGLEVSVNRTSDGVWFGLHDATLLRTSGVDIDPATATWAEVQQYAIAPPSGYPQPSRPYMRLEEVLEAYGESHVLILDPKVQLSRGAELLDLALQYVPSYRLIAKYSGMTSNTSFASAAHARGITTWGYFYEDTIGNVPTKHEQWDILGIEWGASQATWDSILSYGKPVVAHICATRSAADTAIAKGASGIQTSGIFNVLTRG